jgi:hypothetical protein
MAFEEVQLRALLKVPHAHLHSAVSRLAAPRPTAPLRSCARAPCGPDVSEAPAGLAPEGMRARLTGRQRNVQWYTNPHAARRARCSGPAENVERTSTRRTPVTTPAQTARRTAHRVQHATCNRQHATCNMRGADECGARTVLSRPPDTARLPSAEIATPDATSCAAQIDACCYVHSRLEGGHRSKRAHAHEGTDPAVRQQRPRARPRASHTTVATGTRGTQAVLGRRTAWPSRTCRAFPCWKSHTRMKLSRLLETPRLPSSGIAAPFTKSCAHQSNASGCAR